MKKAWLLGCLMLGLVSAVGCNGGSSEKADAGVDPKVLRGQYIMNDVGMCSFCHTPLLQDGTRDTTKQFAGWICFLDLDQTPGNGFGCLSSRNLTPDMTTGLGARTDAEIKHAFQDGVRTDGKNLIPIMPYWVFHNMTSDDADSIIAYLRSIPAVNQQIPPNEMPWDQGWPAPVAPLDLSTQVPMPRSDFTGDAAAAMRGRYLAGQTSLCIDCHTPTLFNGQPGSDPNNDWKDRTKMFAGGDFFAAVNLGNPAAFSQQMVQVPNITSDATTGLAAENWTVTDVYNLLRTGKDNGMSKNDNGTVNFVCAGVHGGPTSPTAALTDADTMDIATYIMSLPAVSNQTDDGCIQTE